MTNSKLLTVQRLLSLIGVLLISSSLCSQRVLLSDPGRTYNDTDGPTLDIYGPVSVSTCTSVEFELDFSFAIPWEGSGNLETSDECAFGVPPCAGNPRSPLGPCANCWDFLWAQFIIDGAEVGGDLIGEAGTTNSEQSGRITLTQCTNGNSGTASINVTTQTWAANEAVTFSGIMILCYEGLPTAGANPNPICTDETLNLTGRIDDPSVVSNHEWTGPGTIDDPFSLNTTVTNIPAGPAVFTLTTTDQNGCTGTDQVTVTVHPTPMAFPAGPLTECSSMGGQADFNLTALNLTVSGGSPGMVMWYRDAGLTSLIANPAMFRSGSTTVYVVVDNGFCQSEVIEVELIVLQQPTARPHTLEACEEVSGTGRATFDLTEIDDIISGGQAGVTVNYYSDAMGIAPVPNPFNTGTTIIYARVDNGECKSNIVEIRIFVYPRPLGKSFNAKFCEGSPGSGILDIDLNTLNDSIRLIPSDRIEWYEDIFLSNRAPNPFTAQIGINVLYVQISDGRCESEPIQINIEILPTPSISSTTLSICEDPPGSGRGTFDLDSIIDLVIGNQMNTSVVFYSDSFGNNVFNSPYTGGDTIIYAQADNGECSSEITAIILQTITPPNAKSHADTTCEDSLGRGTFYPGEWEEFIAFDAAVEDIQVAFDSFFTQPVPSPLHTGDTTIYARVLNGACPSSWVTVTLTVLPAPILDVIAGIDACDSVTLPNISGINLGNNTGYSSEKNQGGNSMSAGDVINQSQRIYFYSSNGLCTDQDSFDINIVEGPEAGPDQVIRICEGANIDLTNYLMGADIGGLFVDDSLSGGLTGNEFNSSGLQGKRLGFTYILAETMFCPGDSSNILIDVVRELDAGADTTIALCLGDSAFLIDLLRMADVGGTYTEVNSSGNLDNGFFKTDLSGVGSFNIDYEVGDGMTCPIDMARITIDVRPNTDIDPKQDVVSCEYHILENITGSNIQNALYYTQPGGMGLSLNPGDTIYTDITLYIFGSLDQCSDEEQFTITILQPAVETVAMTVCNEDTLLIGGQLFDKNRFQDTLTLTSMASNGCDSIIKVNITFRSSPSGDFQGTFCGDTSFLINGVLYDRNNSSGQEIITNGSIHGCDSTVDISLSFIQSVLDLDSTLCEGDFIRVNGTIYDEFRRNGTEVLAGQGQAGCDSTIEIQLDFLPAPTETITQSLCGDEEIWVNNVVYNRSNPSGRDTIFGGANNGCDSLIEVALTFLEDRDTMIEQLICASDTVVVNGRNYFFGNNSGLDTLKNGASTGCDSIIQIEIDFLEGARLELADTLCPEDFIIVNQFRYDINNPSGSQKINGGASNGCDSIIVVNLAFEDYTLSPSISDFEINTGESVNIQFNTDLPYTQIVWSDTTGVSCTNCLNPEISPSQSGTYTVTFIDDNGCELTATINIRLIVNKNVYIPNSFTPNGDNINDLIRLFAKEGVVRKVNSFRIFDRWGELVYEETNTSIDDNTHVGWDGVFSGELVNPNVFVVHADVELSNGEILNLSGSLTLLR